MFDFSFYVFGWRGLSQMLKPGGEKLAIPNRFDSSSTLGIFVYPFGFAFFLRFGLQVPMIFVILI